MRRVSDLNVASNIPLPAPALMLHEIARSEALLTCDDRFVKRARRASALIRVLNPLEYYQEVAND